MRYVIGNRALSRGVEAGEHDHALRLEGFTRLKVPADTEWELLVVNNNCTDRTDDVIRLFENRLPIRIRASFATD